MKWIFGILALLLLTVSVISLWHFNNLWLPLMAGLGAIFGVLMALTYPWALAISGIIVWVAIGIVGLSTGS